MNYTPRQLEILRFITETRREFGFSPSARDICRRLEGLNVKTVAEHHSLVGWRLGS